MAKTETSTNGSQVFLSHKAQSQLRTMQRQLASISDDNFEIYAGKGGQSKVITMALTALHERLNKEEHSQG